MFNLVLFCCLSMIYGAAFLTEMGAHHTPLPLAPPCSDLSNGYAVAADRGAGKSNVVGKMALGYQRRGLQYKANWRRHDV